VPRLLRLGWQLLPRGMGHFACGVRLWLARLQREPLLYGVGTAVISAAAAATFATAVASAAIASATTFSIACATSSIASATPIAATAATVTIAIGALTIAAATTFATATIAFNALAIAATTTFAAATIAFAATVTTTWLHTGMRQLLSACGVLSV